MSRDDPIVTWMTETGAMPKNLARVEDSVRMLTNEDTGEEQEWTDTEMRSDKVGYPMRRERSDPKNDEKSEHTVPADLLALLWVSHDFDSPCFDSSSIEWESEERGPKDR